MAATTPGYAGCKCKHHVPEMRRCDRQKGWNCITVKPVSQGGDLWDPDNLLIVCLDCHVESHQNLDKEQIEWRRYVETLR